MDNVKDIKDLAMAEIQAEKVAEAKKRIKAKLAEKDRAEAVLKNINRELEDLLDELSND